ncbi:MAG TPA: hypothetical protein VFR71_06435 [Methyloceanibacter sp.]|jgi:hypothetical protein|nr:hypothetical protein [Methyloceanibacter sp.]
MKLTKKSGANIATAAAVLVASGVLISSALAVEVQGRCFGINGCAGKGECKSAKNDCKGKNACKAQGWVKMKEDECSKLKGQYQG